MLQVPFAQSSRVLSLSVPSRWYDLSFLRHLEFVAEEYLTEVEVERIFNVNGCNDISSFCLINSKTDKIDWFFEVFHPFLIKYTRIDTFLMSFGLFSINLEHFNFIQTCFNQFRHGNVDSSEEVCIKILIKIWLDENPLQFIIWFNHLSLPVW